ncbi:glycosyltransferase [Aliifodinibius salipaludis]|nr:glycosyltransferase [Aliifodinibius salipaludis]
MKKNILIISRSFYPMNSPRSFRTTELVKEFARQGHEVTLLTVKDDEHHIAFEDEYGVTIKDLGPLHFPEIILNGEHGLSRLFKRIMRRGLLQLFEYPNIELLFKVKHALKTESGYDMLISIAVPHSIHWGVAKAMKGKGEVADLWVADCGDPYMGSKIDSYNKTFYFKYLEKEFCRKADFITVPVEDAKLGYYPEFRDKIEVIPQGFRFDEVEIDYSSYSKHEVPTFAYAGGFIPGGRDPRPFLDHLLSTDRDFKFIIYTKSSDMVKPWVEVSSGRIEIRDYIPRKELLKILSTMDFLVNFENQSSLMVPSKLIDYYLAGRPVLNISANGIDNEKVGRFLDGNYEQKYKYNGVERYRIENVCSQFLKLYDKVEGHVSVK